MLDIKSAQVEINSILNTEEETLSELKHITIENIQNKTQSKMTENK